MNRLIFYCLLLVYTLSALKASTQDKRGNTFVFGAGGIYASFTDTSKPTVGRYYNPPWNYPIMNGHSNISDSATGRSVLICNGMTLWDTLGNVIDSGDSLQPTKMYNQNCCPTASGVTQNSIILPKGSSGKYYVFVSSITDTSYDFYISNPYGDGRFPYNILQYNVVDMNANGGQGKVVQKNISILENKEIFKTGMMACKHANGYDWWLLKQGAKDNTIYIFKVTRDTVLLNTVQSFPLPHFGYYDLAGGSSFNNTGSKYAFATGGYLSDGAHLFISDFDRCNGTVGNVAEIKVPYDSTLTIFDSLWNSFDSLITGVCFSPNDSFLYVSRRYNIYQYDLFEPDSSLRWSRIQAGPDTTQSDFSTYNNMVLGPDGRIYISKSDCIPTNNSVIDFPNKKGLACHVCKQCLAYLLGPCTSAMPNMPNFNMLKKEPCWPLDTGNVNTKIEWSFYPNPANERIVIKNAEGKQKILYNSVGQVLAVSSKSEIDVSKLAKGLYFVKCGNTAKKLLVE